MKTCFRCIWMILVAFQLPGSLLHSESQVRFIAENDGYGGFSDQYYSNAPRWVFNTDAGEDNWTRKFFRGWNNFFIPNSEETRYPMGFGLGQEFITPTNISKDEPSFGDRPYASRGYVGNPLTNRTESTSVTTELESGMIRPSVGGKTVQMRFHNYIRSPIPQGWDTQIPDSNVVI